MTAGPDGDLQQQTEQTVETILKGMEKNPDDKVSGHWVREGGLR
jgi:hypothetical protein